MALLQKAKINKVSTNLSNYYYLIQGQQKTGKTTFARDFVLKVCNGDAEQGLLLAIGKEKGYKALDNIQALDIETWKDFEAVIKELVEGKDKEHNIKYVFIDTYDELIPLAEKEIMRLSQITTGKPCKTLNSAFGGYGAGRIELRKLVTEKLDTLNKHFGLIVLGHTKLKTIKEQSMLEDQEYQVLSSNLNADYHNIVAHKADVIATVVVEKEVDEKRVASTKTYVYFRGNGFIEAGCRFKNIPEKVEFNADNFITAIEDAIMSTSSTPITREEIKRQATVLETVEESVEEEVTSNDEVSSEEVTTKKTQTEIFAEIKPLYTKADTSQKMEVKNILKKYGQTKFDMTADIKMFEEVLEVLR